MTPIQSALLVGLAVGFAAGVFLLDWLVRRREARAARGWWRDHAASEWRWRDFDDAHKAALEARGLCPRCWGDCPPSGCTAQLPSSPLFGEDDADADEYAALVARYPRLTPDQIESVFERRVQERR